MQADLVSVCLGLAHASTIVLSLYRHSWDASWPCLCVPWFGLCVDNLLSVQQGSVVLGPPLVRPMVTPLILYILSPGSKGRLATGNTGTYPTQWSWSTEWTHLNSCYIRVCNSAGWKPMYTVVTDEYNLYCTQFAHLTCTDASEFVVWMILVSLLFGQSYTFNNF